MFQGIGPLKDLGGLRFVYVILFLRVRYLASCGQRLFLTLGRSGSSRSSGNGNSNTNKSH